MPFDTCGETTSAPDGLFLSDISSKDKPWDRHRSRAAMVEQLYTECGYGRYAERINQCSLSLGFKPSTDERNLHQLKLKLFSAAFCRVRHCPVCQWRRSMMWQARTFQMLPRLQEAHPKHRYIFLTLTVRNVPLTGLRAAIQQMNKAWGRLSQRKAFPGLGWVKSIEVTRNPVSDEAHPHIHALLMVNPSYFSGTTYLSQAKWTELWQKSLRVDYQPIVNVKAVKPKPGQADPIEAVRAAVVETVKYSVKEEDLIGKKHQQDNRETTMTDADWLMELTKQLHKMRSVAVGGVFKDFMSDEEPENLVGASEEEIGSKAAEIFFGWDLKTKRYRHTDK